VSRLATAPLQLMLAYRLCLLSLSCAAAALHRRHLMVWAVFAPKVRVPLANDKTYSTFAYSPFYHLDSRVRCHTHNNQHIMHHNITPRLPLSQVVFEVCFWAAASLPAVAASIFLRV
jgi:hypothetical protein